MTYDELREAVARAMNEAALKARTENPDIPDEEYDAVQADAALATVYEALREPSEEMQRAAGRRLAWAPRADDTLYAAAWRTMLAASPLGGPGHE